MKLTTKRKDKKESQKLETASAVQYETLKTEQGDYLTLFSRKHLNRKSYKPLNLKHVVSAIPGTITKLYFSAKDQVAEGDVLLELDAMKMHNKILAPTAGIIKDIHVKEGERVPKNFLMVEFE